jgi:hypothetical protein
MSMASQLRRRFAQAGSADSVEAAQAGLLAARELGSKVESKVWFDIWLCS